jgi:hypothetical protein
LRKEVVFSSIKILLKRILAGFSIHSVWKCLVSVDCTIARVRKFLTSVGFTIARLWIFCMFLYSQGATAFVCGKNKRLLDASRRRILYGEMASEWFGYYSLS